MHDPKTVAFEIRSPFKDKHGYGNPIITIWHNDPETDGTDDSCGWTFPKLTEKEIEYLKKVAKDQYGQLYARKEAIREQLSYASICHNQDIFGVIYWLFRVFNKGKEKWQYGTPLTNKEFQFVYELAYNPVDNFQHHKNNTLDEFERFIFLVYRCYKRFKRPWYKHPRWHIHHWSIKFHPWQRFKRRYIQKCSVCGKRGFKGAAYGSWGGNEIWCETCNGTKLKNN